MARTKKKTRVRSSQIRGFEVIRLTHAALNPEVDDDPRVKQALSWVKSLSLIGDGEDGPRLKLWIEEQHSSPYRFVITFFLFRAETCIATASVAPDDRDVGRENGVMGWWCGGVYVDSKYRRGAKGRNLYSALVELVHNHVQDLANASPRRIPLNVWTREPYFAGELTVVGFEKRGELYNSTLSLGSYLRKVFAPPSEVKSTEPFLTEAEMNELWGPDAVYRGDPSGLTLVQKIPKILTSGSESGRDKPVTAELSDDTKRAAASAPAAKLEHVLSLKELTFSVLEHEVLELGRRRVSEVLRKSEEAVLQDLSRVVANLLTKINEVPRDERTMGSLESNKDLASRLQRIVLLSGSRLRCPSCGHPGRLRCRSGTSPQGAFEFAHDQADAPKQTCGGWSRLPELSLVDK